MNKKCTQTLTNIKTLKPKSMNQKPTRANLKWSLQHIGSIIFTNLNYNF